MRAGNGKYLYHLILVAAAIGLAIAVLPAGVRAAERCVTETAAWEKALRNLSTKPENVDVQEMFILHTSQVNACSEGLTTARKIAPKQAVRFEQGDIGTSGSGKNYSTLHCQTGGGIFGVPNARYALPGLVGRTQCISPTERLTLDTQVEAVAARFTSVSVDSADSAGSQCVGSVCTPTREGTMRLRLSYSAPSVTVFAHLVDGTGISTRDPFQATLGEPTVAWSDLTRTVEYDVSCATDPTKCPLAPVLTVYPPSGTLRVSTDYSFGAKATDGNHDSIRYGFDWDRNGQVEEWVPASGYVAENITQYARHQWATPGTKTVRIYAEDSSPDHLQVYKEVTISIQEANSGSSGRVDLKVRYPTGIGPQYDGPLTIEKDLTSGLAVYDIVPDVPDHSICDLWGDWGNRTQNLYDPAPYTAQQISKSISGTYTYYIFCQYPDGGSSGGVRTGEDSVTVTVWNATPPTTLTASLTADPDHGTLPGFTSTLHAVAGGSETAATLNYTFWWDCSLPGTDVAALSKDVGAGGCGDPNDARYGYKRNGTTSTTLDTTHWYRYVGIYQPKVVIERGARAATSSAIVTVSSAADTEVIADLQAMQAYAMSDGSIRYDRDTLEPALLTVNRRNGQETPFALQYEKSVAGTGGASATCKLSRFLNPGDLRYGWDTYETVQSWANGNYEKGEILQEKDLGTYRYMLECGLAGNWRVDYVTVIVQDQAAKSLFAELKADTPNGTAPVGGEFETKITATRLPASTTEGEITYTFYCGLAGEVGTKITHENPPATDSAFVSCTYPYKDTATEYFPRVVVAQDGISVSDSTRVSVEPEPVVVGNPSLTFTARSASNPALVNTGEVGTVLNIKEGDTIYFTWKGENLRAVAQPSFGYDLWEVGSNGWDATGAALKLSCEVAGGDCGYSSPTVPVGASEAEYRFSLVGTGTNGSPVQANTIYVHVSKDLTGGDSPYNYSSGSRSF